MTLTLTWTRRGGGGGRRGGEGGEDGTVQNFGPIVITIPKMNQIGGKVRK